MPHLLGLEKRYATVIRSEDRWRSLKVLKKNIPKNGHTRRLARYTSYLDVHPFSSGKIYQAVGCHPKKTVFNPTTFAPEQKLGGWFLNQLDTFQQRSGTLFFHPWRVNFAKKKCVRDCLMVSKTDFYPKNPDPSL